MIEYSLALVRWTSAKLQKRFNFIELAEIQGW